MSDASARHEAIYRTDATMTTVMMPIVDGEISSHHWAMIRGSIRDALCAVEDLEWRGASSSEITDAAARLALMQRRELCAYDVRGLSAAHSALAHALSGRSF